LEKKIIRSKKSEKKKPTVIFGEKKNNAKQNLVICVLALLG
jgi:hypothetical protein